MGFRKIRWAILPVLTAMIIAAGIMPISAEENDSGFVADINCVKSLLSDSIKDELSAPAIENSDSAELIKDDSLFFDEIKKYPPVEISLSCEALELSIKLPDGMKFNHLAPFDIELISSKPEVIEPEKFDITKGSAKLKLPIVVNPGEAVLTVDLNFSFCGIKNASLCYFKDIRLEIPVRVAKSANNNFSIKYEVFE